MWNKKEFACILEPVINQNHTLKKTMAKICQETDLTCVKLPVALLRIRMCPRSRLQLSPYEMLCERIFLYSEQLSGQTCD